MDMMLMLRYKEVFENDTYYIFDTPYGRKRVSYNEAVRLIQSVQSQNRNCKITKGNIGLKQGYGSLRKIIRRKEKVVRIITKPAYFYK